MSRGLLAWPVDIEPSWPVFMAWSMSSASPPRHSPTMMRSGRMRSELRTSSRMVIAPLPSMLARARLQRHDVLLAQLQLGGVLDGDDALVVRDERRQHVEQGGLAGAGAARDDDVQPRLDTGAQEVEHLGRRAVPKRIRSSVVSGVVENFRMVSTGPTSEIGGMTTLTREPSARRASTIGRGLVDAAAERRDDAVDDAHHVLVVLERDVGQLDLARALDVDLARAVDHHFGDGLVAQQRLDRAEADDLVGDLLQHTRSLGAGQRQPFGIEGASERLFDLAANLDLIR